jgi:uncharacterized delta-60 repeat protein
MPRTRTQTAGRRLLLAASVVALLLIPAAAPAAPGALDPSFGQGGIVTTAFGSSHEGAYDLALQPDGKTVAGGSSSNGSDSDFALARYNPNGTLDPSFGSGGKVTTAFGSSHESISALALQPDGKLVAAGYAATGPSTSVFALARYNPNGALDSSFGSGGKVITALGSGAEDGANALVLQPDGKLVAVGAVWNGTRSVFALARYNPNGSLDVSFGQGGKVTTAIGSGWAHATALALQADGKLVAAGATSGGLDYDLALIRYNANGTLDPSFGSGGIVTTTIGPGYDSAYALALLPDGKLVIAGQSWTGSHYDVLLARYSPSGALDPSFGSGGKVTSSLGSGDALARALAVQPDGSLVVAGASSNAGSLQHFTVARYSANGTLDPSFGSGGKLMTPVGSDSDGASALALQPDGKPVAAGTTYDGTDSDFALVRYLGSELTVAKAGNGSGTVTSSPNGIACGSTCTAPFAAVSVTLKATAPPGSAFAGWSGDCSGKGTCTVSMSASRSVTATFEIACTVPKLKGKTFRAAKRALTKAHCSVGKRTRAFSSKVRKGRVIASKPGQGRTLARGARIRLQVSKGPR